MKAKAGFYGLKSKEISLISIVLMSTTIIIWSWEKTPDLTALIPPQTRMQLSSDNLLSGSVVNLLAPEPRIHEDEDDSLLADKKTTNELKELHLNVASQTVSAQSSSGRGESNIGTPVIYRTNSLKRVR